MVALISCVVSVITDKDVLISVGCQLLDMGFGAPHKSHRSNNV